jgi:hypothetical protein
MADERDLGEHRVPSNAQDSATPSHQRAAFNDPLPGGDPTAPGAPHEAGGEALTQSTSINPKTSKSLRVDDEQKGRPAE